MNKLTSLSEEIAAMAKSDPNESNSPLRIQSTNDEIKPTNAANQSDTISEPKKKRKKKKNRDKLVQEIRISVSIFP